MTIRNISKLGKAVILSKTFVFLKRHMHNLQYVCNIFANLQIVRLKKKNYVEGVDNLNPQISMCEKVLILSIKKKKKMWNELKTRTRHLY